MREAQKWEHPRDPCAPPLWPSRTTQDHGFPNSLPWKPETRSIFMDTRARCILGTPRCKPIGAVMTVFMTAIKFKNSL